MLFDTGAALSIMKNFFNNKCIVLIIIYLFSFSLTYSEVNTDGCKEFEKNESPFSGLLRDKPPLISYVETNLISPTQNDDVIVKATVYNDPKLTDEEIKEVFLTYSTDEGKTWNKIKMLKELDENVWVAKIPKNPKWTKVIYYISVIDSGGNLTTELPELSNTLSLLDKIPSITDPDDKIIKYNLDIIKAAIGYDGEKIYMIIKVKDKITDVETSHMQANVYGILTFLNNDSPTYSIRYEPLLPNIVNSLPKAGIYRLDENQKEIKKYKSQNIFKKLGRLLKKIILLPHSIQLNVLKR